MAATFLGYMYQNQLRIINLKSIELEALGVKLYAQNLINIKLCITFYEQILY